MIRVDDYLQVLIENARAYPPLHWILQSRQFRFSDELPLSGEERLSSALGILTLKKRQNLIIEHPYPSSRLSVIAAIGLLVADIAEQRISGQPLIQGDIVLVTRNVGKARSELGNVKLDRINISEVWQIEKSQNVAKSKNHERLRLLISAPRPQNIINYNNDGGVLIIDGSHPSTREQLTDLLADSCFSQSLKILLLPLGFGYSFGFDSSNWIRWLWYTNRSELTVNQGATQFKEETIEIPEHRLFLCSDKKLDEQLSLVRSKLSELSQLVGNKPPIELLKAWGIYNRLSSLAVPLGQYEDYAQRHFWARPIKHGIEQLYSSEVKINNAKSQIAWDSQWRPLLETLSEAYECLKGDMPAKFWGIANVVEDYIVSEFDRPLTLLCPTQMEGNLLLRHLDSVCTNLVRFLHPDGLRIATPKQLASHPEWQHGDVATISTYTSRWRFFNLTLRHQTKILYPHEADLELAIIKILVDKINGSTTPQSRANIVNSLVGKQALNEIADVSSPTFQVTISISNIDNLPSRKYNEETKESHEVFSPSWAWDADDITFVPPIMNGSSNSLYREIDKNMGVWLKISFTNGTNLEVPANYTFDVFRRVTSEIEECSAEALEPGDIIILISDGKYSRLFERIIEALEAHPKFALLSVWLNIWDMAKGEALEACDNRYRELHKRLRDRGIEITEQAIRTWYSGVMAPRSEDAIYAMIQMSENKAALSHQVELRSALGHIRGMRRQVGRKIRQMIRDAATGDEFNPSASLEDLAIEDVIAASERVVVERVSRWDAVTTD